MELYADWISAQREDVQRLKAEQNELEQRQRERRAQFNQCEQAIVRHQKASSRLRLEWQQAQTTVEELQDALDRDAVEEGRLDALKDQLAEATDEKSTHESSYENSVVEKDKLFKGLKATKDQMTDFDNSIKEAEAKLLKAEHRATQRANSREIALRDKNGALEAVDRVLQDRRETQKERDDKATTVETFKQEAGLIHPRVPIARGETCKNLEEKLNKMNVDLRKAERRLFDIRPLLPNMADTRVHQDWRQCCPNRCRSYQDFKCLAPSPGRS